MLRMDFPMVLRQGDRGQLEFGDKVSEICGYYLFVCESKFNDVEQRKNAPYLRGVFELLHRFFQFFNLFGGNWLALTTPFSTRP